MSEPEALDRDEQVLEAHVAQLAEFFDTVQIVATRHGRERSSVWARGAGNWYGRIGSVRAWMLREEETWTRGAPDDDPDEEDGA